MSSVSLRVQRNRDGAFSEHSFPGSICLLGCLQEGGVNFGFSQWIACLDDAGHRDVTSCKTIDKLQPRQIFSLDDKSNNSTPGHQRIKAT